MALANKATMVTKYVAGGTGDNIIPDGYIKSVEKVWIDTYTYSSAATIGQGMVIDIAIIPQGKKIAAIEVYGIGPLSATSTNAISIGARYGTTATTNATQFLAATTFGTATMVGQMLVDPAIYANAGLGVECTGSTHTIFVQFTAASPSVTAGTLVFKTKYT